LCRAKSMDISSLKHTTFIYETYQQNIEFQCRGDLNLRATNLILYGLNIFVLSVLRPVVFL